MSVVGGINLRKTQGLGQLGQRTVTLGHGREEVIPELRHVIAALRHGAGGAAGGRSSPSKPQGSCAPSRDEEVIVCDSSSAYATGRSASSRRLLVARRGSVRVPV